MPHSSKATYGDVAHSAVELMVVLTNLASVGVVASPGAASRIVVWEPLVWSSSVHQLEGWADGGLEDAQQRTW
jgi:hypothetical protein